MRYMVGVDFGQAHDWTAVCILEHVQPPRPVPTTEEEQDALHRVRSVDLALEDMPAPLRRYVEMPKDELHVRYLERPRLRTSYTKICKGVIKRATALDKPSSDPDKPRPVVGVALDATGVGRGPKDILTDMIRDLDSATSPRIRLVPINVTGGEKVTMHGGFYGVPKRDLIFAGITALQEERLRIAASVKNRDILIKELLDYRMTINIKTGHDSYEPWWEASTMTSCSPCAQPCGPLKG